MAALAACSSQVDDLGTVVVRASPATPGGIYQGTMLSQSSTTPVPVMALVDDLDTQQHFVIYASDGSFLESGLFTTVGTGLTGQARYFDLTGATTASQTVSFTGNYVQQSQIGGQYSRMTANSSGSSSTVTDSGQLSLNYQGTDYETPSALALLQGVWSNVDAYGTAQTSFSLDSGGDVSGQVLSTNCTYNGTIATIDQRYNVYSITKLTETCGSSPVQLTGLATLLPASTATNGKPQLVLAVSAASVGRLFRLNPGS
jgi:hypothetical protein